MRLSQLFTKTTKETPKDETSKGAQLLLRAGFIHKEMAGVYTFLPLGLKVLKNIEQIVREEMDKIGGQELQMTTLQPKDIWEKTGRWSHDEVDVWFKTALQNEVEIGLAPTHEEPMTRIVSRYANSYKDLPIYTYQFQWKMRNELRAKSGIMRCREFYMKDLYSFSVDQQQHDKFYQKSREAYENVYIRLGLGHNTYYTYASGGMFSKYSHEFQTVLEVGEDIIYIDDKQKVAINEEIINDEAVLKELGVKKADLRKVKAAEVGNIFPLATKFSEPLGAVFTDEHGKQHPMIMGSYGIGVSRLVGVLAEFFADDKGLAWPESVAPAQVSLVRIGEDAKVVAAADKLYDQLQTNGFSVLYDDRDESAGGKFADADLIGCPVRLTVSPKTLEKNSAELKFRHLDEIKLLSLDKAAHPLKSS
ncbi:MAG TPA: aminoacyl--tRNA ligase-related protein [Candidatus Saccharimonadales bacterium]|nr:aminoacyl--tRNA ligase-related protein [Candidatus Saccharimonadales bacterium]